MLQEYGQWIMSHAPRVEMVVDVHTPLSDYVAEQRQTDEQFTLSPDGVHPNSTGHRLLGEAVLKGVGD